MAFYNDSKFHMWRACVGVIWLDNKVDSKELEWITEKLETLKFTAEQKRILEGDLKNGVDFETVVSKITNRSDRAFLCHQMRVISHTDEDYSDEEFEKLEKWRELVLDESDIGLGIYKVDQIEKEYKNKEFEPANKNSIFEKNYNKLRYMISLASEDDEAEV